MESVGLASLARAQCEPFMSFPEIAGLDNLRLPGGTSHLEFPHPECSLVPVSSQLLDEVSTLIWTHELPGDILNVPLSARKHFYMVRDGRDAITSMIHYSVKTKPRRLRPEYTMESAEEVYSDTNLFEKWAIEQASVRR